MTTLLDFGTLAALDTVAAGFLQAIGQAAVPGPAQFTEWSQQILVDHPEKRALVLPAGTVLPADLLLDASAEPFAEGGVSCVVALGDLTVTGRVINPDAEAGPALLVAGNLTARDLIAAASGIVVLGNIEAQGIILCDGDNGALLAGGNLKAAAIIDCDHEILVCGDVEARVASDDLGNMRAMLVSDVFEDPDDPANEWPEGDLIRDRLLQGLPVLKD